MFDLYYILRTFDTFHYITTFKKFQKLNTKTLFKNINVKSSIINLTKDKTEEIINNNTPPEFTNETLFGTLEKDAATKLFMDINKAFFKTYDITKPAKFYRNSIIDKVYIDSPLIEKINDVYRKQILNLSPSNKEDCEYSFEYLSPTFISKYMEDCFKNDSYISGLESEIERLDIGINRIFSYFKQNTKSAPKNKSKHQSNCVKIIIASSGMCDKGRVVKHLKDNIDNSNTMVIITGYQAYKSTGYYLKNMDSYDTIKKSKIELVDFDSKLQSVKFKVKDFSQYYSSHADQSQLVDYLSYGIDKYPIGRTVFINHGNKEARNALKESIENSNDKFKVILPAKNMKYSLNDIEETEVERPIEPIADIQDIQAIALTKSEQNNTISLENHNNIILEKGKIKVSIPPNDFELFKQIYQYISEQEAE
jgi:hypothetical protein